MTGPQDRSRLARALAEFWRGGTGPTHDDLTRVFDSLDLDLGEQQVGNKRDRVLAAVEQADAVALPRLLAELIDLLHEDGCFEGPRKADDKVIDLLQKRLRPFGLRVSEHGELIGGARLGIEPASLIDLPAVRDHIRRIQLAIDNDDSPLMLGASKELLETTSKVVLRAAVIDEPDDFPALLSRALEALGLHPKKRSGNDEVGLATKKVLGGLQQIGLGINDLRNAYGTGHGRAEPVRLGLRHARLAAGAAIVLATTMIDTLEDPKAPWRATEQAHEASEERAG